MLDRRRDFFNKVVDVCGAIFVRGRYDFDQGDKAVAADVANRQRTAPDEERRFHRLFTRDARRRFRDGYPARGRRPPAGRRGIALGVQRENIGDRLARVLLGQSVVSVRQQPFVERVSQRSGPDCVKVVEDTSFD